MSMSNVDFEKFQRALQDGKLEDALVLLRSSGLSKVESIVLLARSGKFDLSAAKQVVHESAAWRDAKEGHDAFQDTVLKHIQGSPKE